MMKAVFTIYLLALMAPGVYADSISTQLKVCAQLTANKDRLVCYDKLSSSLKQRSEQDFGQEQKFISEAPDSIEARIQKIQKGAYDKNIITLENGQVWKQNDSSRAHWKSGDLVIVERALFGSFFMKTVNGGRKMRVKRLK
ncbi:hypothetical protein [Microbulbifer epialgicus]|uniref:Uncharacterized protein n=1 Tax=Microbulbifer epialgicus TaxID=393907 RepID=A0ABV4NZ70_9GAMM